MKLINLLIIALSAASTNPVAAVAADENNNKATVATNLLRGTFDSAFNLIMASNTEGVANSCSSDKDCWQIAILTELCCDSLCASSSSLCCDMNGNNPSCPVGGNTDNCPYGTCSGTAEEDVEEVEEDVAARPPALIAANSS